MIRVMIVDDHKMLREGLTSVFLKNDCVDRTQAAIFCIQNGVVSVHD